MLFAWICILATTLAINTIFVMTLFAGLNWEERTAILFASAALAAGILLTLRSARSLTAPSHRE